MTSVSSSELGFIVDISSDYELESAVNDIPIEDSSMLTIRFREALAAPSDASDIYHTISREESI